jgi:uncharacterized membrane protein (UPF0127 family)
MIRRPMRWVVTAALFGLLASAASAQDDADLDARFERDVAVIVASRNACHRFDIYLALTNPQQMRGLMFVRDLPETTGMLFVYDREGPRSMWMKNTFIPLDIAFIRRDGSVINIAYSTEPQSLKSIRANEPAQYVLELNAGVAERFGIDTQSVVVWGPIFGERD